MPLNRPQMPIGHRAISDWTEGDTLSEYAVGDVIYVPPDAPAIQDERVEGPGLYRVESVFSISEDPDFYYRLSPTRIVDGRRLATDWNSVSDRIHVIPGTCDWTEGFVRLYEAAPQTATVSVAPKDDSMTTSQSEGV